MSQVNNELPYVLFKRTSYKAKKKCLKKCEILYINKILLVLRKLDETPNENVDPKFLLDATLITRH